MRRFWLSVIALLLLYGGVALGNYAATVGAGTNFGSTVIAGVHFASQLICDFTTANQCASVTASNALKVDNSAVTQPVSNAGTFAAQLTGATNNINNITGTVSLMTGAATSANQTNGTQQTKVTDGSNIAAVKAASTAPLATDPAVVVSISPNSVNANGQATMANSAPVVIASNQSTINTALTAGTANVGQVGGSVNITPTDCSIALTLGGTAQNIITAGATLHGFTIANIDTAAGSGEPVWMSFTTTAAASTIASYPLAAPTATTFAGLSSYTTPLGFGTNANVSVVAATTGHKISCTKW